MAGTSNGPVATLPGSYAGLPAGTVCDEHPDRPAVRRIQGETDSFGCEFYDMCDECVIEHNKQIANNRSGICDWCKNDAEDLRPKRDYEEGRYGPVYRVCRDCAKKYDENWDDD